MELLEGQKLLSASAIPQMLGGVMAAFVAYQVAVGVYNVYFHPLRKFPGPLLYRASRLPYVLAILRGDINAVVSAAHEKYGEVVRVAPTELSFISGETAWQDIYGFRGAKKAEFSKDWNWYSIAPNGVRSLVSASREDHARQRRVFSHAFSDKALRDQEPLIQDYVDLLVRRLHEKAAAKRDVDMVRYYNFTTFDVIGDLTFGEPFGCLASDDYHAFVAGVFKSVRAISLRLALRYYKLAERMYFALMQDGKAQGNVKFHNFTADKVDKRLQAETKRPDIITAVENAPDSRAIHTEELKSTSALFLIAGSETTATTLSGTTYLLLKHPRVMRQLCDEIRAAFASYADITIERVNQLPYLIAVLNEGLRVYPPVPTGFPRVAPPGGDSVSGYFVPEKTSVYVSQYPAYHSSRNFAEPNSFIPERWLGEDARFASDKRSVLMPFSNGPRNCLGKNLAYAEMRLILAKVLYEFDLELLEDQMEKGWFDQKVFMLWEKSPLPARLVPVSRG